MNEINFQSSRYGEIITAINREGFNICTDLRLKQRLKNENKSIRKDLGDFCYPYGFEKVRAPSSKIKRKHKKYFKANKEKTYKKYYNMK